MIDNLVTIVVALRYPLMLISGICIGILASRAWLDCGRPIHGPAVTWPPSRGRRTRRRVRSVGQASARHRRRARVRQDPRADSRTSRGGVMNYIYSFDDPRDEPLMERHPLDRAVDRACDALDDVVRLAQLHGAWDLANFARTARRDLLDTWEDSE